MASAQLRSNSPSAASRCSIASSYRPAPGGSELLVEDGLRRANVAQEVLVLSALARRVREMSGDSSIDGHNIVAERDRLGPDERVFATPSAQPFIATAHVAVNFTLDT